LKIAERLRAAWQAVPPEARWAFGVIAVLQLAHLAVFGPLYDLDIHYYTRGAFQWEPQRPPLYAFVLSVLRRIWASVWLPLVLQMLAYAAGGAALLSVVFRGRLGWAVAGAVALGLEPVAAYLNVSLMSEGLFMAFLFCATAVLLRYAQAPTTRRALWAGGWLGLALLERYVALFSVPPMALGMLRQQETGNRKQETTGRQQETGNKKQETDEEGPASARPLMGFATPFGNQLTKGKWGFLFPVSCFLLPVLLSVSITYTGHKLQSGGGFLTGLGRVRFDNVSQYYTPGLCPAAWDLCPYLDSAHAVSGHKWAEPFERYSATNRVIELYEQAPQNQGRTPAQVYVRADSALGTLATRIERQFFWQIRFDLMANNCRKAWADNELYYADRLLTMAPNTPLHDSYSIEYDYLHQMMQSLYGYSRPHAPAHPLWTQPDALTPYVRLVLVLGGLLGVLVPVVPALRRRPFGWRLVAAYAVPFAFLLLGVVPLQTRFLGVYFGLVWVAALWAISRLAVRR